MSVNSGHSIGLDLAYLAATRRLASGGSGSSASGDDRRFIEEVADSDSGDDRRFIEEVAAALQRARLRGIVSEREYAFLMRGVNAEGNASKHRRLNPDPS